MQQHSTNLDVFHNIHMHEALTPELFRQIYSDGQLPVKHQLVSIYVWLKCNFMRILKVR